MVKFMKWNLRTKILVTCLCSALGALLLQTLLFQNASSSLIYRQAEMESYNSLQNMQNELETFFRGIETGIIEIYNDQEYLKDLSGDYNLAALQDKYYRRAKLLATDKFATSDNVLALYLYTEKHEIVSTYRKNMTPHRKYPKDIYEDPEAYNADVVKRYVESDDNRMMISSYQSPYSNKTIIRFVEKIHNMNKLDERIGYVICDVDIKVIEKIMSKYTVSDNTYIWLQPTGDQMICALDNPDKTNQEYFEQLCEYIQQGRTEEIDSIEKAGNELFSVGQKKYNLTAYEIMPQSLLKQNQMLLTRNLIVIAISLTVILTLLTLYLTRILTKPLENLTDTVTKISEGNTELRVDYTKTDEIGNLGEQFNHMLDEIQLLVGKEYEQRLLLEQAEYKALQAQINPHFLYNTLDTMSSIASIQDCEIVSQLCQSLSSIFRYSLD
ncbi:MAG: sensor histidine kinase, partial [Lachnospiraceae bacterium]